MSHSSKKEIRAYSCTMHSPHAGGCLMIDIISWFMNFFLFLMSCMNRTSRWTEKRHHSSFIFLIYGLIIWDFTFWQQKMRSNLWSCWYRNSLKKLQVEGLTFKTMFTVKCTHVIFSQMICHAIIWSLLFRNKLLLSNWRSKHAGFHIGEYTLYMDDVGVCCSRYGKKDESFDHQVLGCYYLEFAHVSTNWALNYTSEHYEE